METDNNTLIELVNVTKVYRNAAQGKVALKDIQLTINQGEFVGVLGANGSGKSTLARLLNGLTQPSEGKVFVLGMDTSDRRNIQEIRRHVGMVFQNPDNQIISSIVEEDIAFGPENLELPEAEIRARVEWAINTLGIEQLRYQAPHLLSGGQKQKVAIAAALAMKPTCLVLDEPSSMLDQKSRLELIDTLHGLNRAGITIILITHNVEDIAAADRLLVLQEGSVCLDVNAGVIFRTPEALQAIGFKPPEIFQLTQDLNRRGYYIPAEITNMFDLADYICKI